MGNDQSHLKGLQIEKKSIEVTDYWSLYNGEIPNDNQSTLISIFQGETIITPEQFWSNQSPLEKSKKVGSTIYSRRVRCVVESLLIFF